MSNKNVQISPASLLFQGPYDRPIMNVITIQNQSDETLVFKVKTTAPKRYVVRPSLDTVLSREKKEVQVL